MPNRPEDQSLESVADSLEGKRIKEIFKRAQIIADFHTTLTSKRGNYFRKHLLSRLGGEGGPDLFRQLRDEAGIQEYDRHIHKLLKFKLIQPVSGEKEAYRRTPFGEEALNAIRGLEREIGADPAHRIYEASLGPNSTRLFLRVYSDRREPDFASRKLKYTPREVGQLTYFLPRTVDGLSAIDKLNEAGLFYYADDGYVYASPVVLRGFYKYLAQLYENLIKSECLGTS